MRLYDKVMAAPGTLVDRAFFGSFTNIAKKLQTAQCFLIEKDLANACEEVCMSRPSSIVSALNHTRLPYPVTWIEWHPNERGLLTIQNDKPAPRRMGCLILSNKEGNKGTAIYMWEHDKKNTPPEYAKYITEGDGSELTLDPFGIIFDWSGSKDPVMVQYAKSIGYSIGEEVWSKKYTGRGREDYRKSLQNSRRWKSLSHFESEVEAYMELEKTAGIVPLDECADMFSSFVGPALLPGGEMHDNFMQDLEGEFAFTQALILMLNTKNSVVQRNKEDLTKLNKSRARNRKPPLKEFTITNIRLNKVHARTANASGMSREVARRHMVRGHFKLRSSGVYWWSAHIRGMGELMKREEYRADL